MKRLEKSLMLLLLALFIVSPCTGAAKKNNDKKNKSEKAASEKNESAYPERSIFPLVEYNGATGSLGKKKGTPVKSPDNIMTIIPRADGLLIHLDLVNEPQKYWRHNNFQIQDITGCPPNDEWRNKPVQVEIGPEAIQGKDNAKFVEFVYPFTKADGVYKIWIEHMGGLRDNGEVDEWKDWGTTEKNPARVTSIGGYGEFNIKASLTNTQLLLPEASLHLAQLTEKLPNAVKKSEKKWHVRAELDTRWGNGKNSEMDFPYEGADIKNLSQLNKNGFSMTGKDKIFFVVRYKMEYAGLSYSQEVFSNYDRWISWYNMDGVKHFPIIKITSTENGGSNDFVTEPVIQHVKDSQKTWGDFSGDNVPNPWYEICEIKCDNELLGTGKVKVRGNWTTSYNKKSLRINFDKKANILGLASGKQYRDWVLLAAYKDASLLRDAVALQMYRKMFKGYASDCRLVEVEVNGTNLGVYLLAELQEAKRLGLSQPAKGAKNTDIGYLIEFDSYYYAEKDNKKFNINYLGDIRDYSGNIVRELQSGYTIKSEIKDKAQHDFIADYMNKLWKICYEASYNRKYYKFDSSYNLVEYTPDGADDNAKCKNCIAQVIDINSMADMYIFNEIVCDPDIYLTSFFMAIDFAEGKDKKLTFTAPWDFDSTMGNKNFCAAEKSAGNITGIYDMFAGRTQTEVNAYQERMYANPWMVIFMNQAWYKNLVKERWSKINRKAVLAEIQTYIDTNSAAVYQPVFDYTRKLWGDPSSNHELCEASKRAAAQSQAASAAYLKQWLTKRFAAVDAIINGLK